MWESPLLWQGCEACAFCADAETAWQHELAAERSAFRSAYGKGQVWGGPTQVLCEPCEQLYQAGDYAALARRRVAVAAQGDDVVDSLVLLAAFCRADRGSRRLPEPDFPPGFAPLRSLMGAEWVLELWPARCRRQTPEPSGWLVCSPWPAVGLVDVFRLLWSWAERDGDREEAVLRGRAEQVLAWDDQQASAYLASLDA